jgi:hypothetical protein
VGDVGYGLAVILAAVFGVAAVAKARQPAATARSLADFGIPAPAVVARVLPVAEAALAVALVAAPAPAAWAALVLLVGFSVVLAVARRHGVTTPCACLGGGAGGAGRGGGGLGGGLGGGVEPEVATPAAELVRNGLLAAAAVVATGAASPRWPGLDAVVTVTAAAAAAAVLVAAVRVKEITGFLFRVPWPEGRPPGPEGR